MASSPGASDISHDSDNDHDNDGQSGSRSSMSKDKDRECHYCHQKFTSSSLGRHLDQFLHKKKPDGIHDVSEIKQTRAGITRRTPRGKKSDHLESSGVNNANEHPTSSHPSPGSRSQSQSHSQSQVSARTTYQDAPTPAFLESLNKSAAGTNDVRFNRMGWQATGVITDHPAMYTVTSPVVAGAASQPLSQSVAGSKRNFSTYTADLPSITATTATTSAAAAAATDTSRALELSLREVLDAVNTARTKSKDLPQPFPFDLTSATFPALVLSLLPTPSTLYQPAPFSTNATIPLKPPGFEQLEPLRQTIRNTLENWKWIALSHFQRDAGRMGLSFGEEAERLNQTTQQKNDDLLIHLDNAYQSFISHSPEQQYQLWSIELLRAYKNEQVKLKDANETLARIVQESNHLQQQVDHLSKCQWPREMAMWPPERNSFTSAVQKELQELKIPAIVPMDPINPYHTGQLVSAQHEDSDDTWDFDTLVNKWKRHVREDRARKGGPGLMLPPVAEISLAPPRTDTPPYSLRKATTENYSVTNGGRVNSASNSPVTQNGTNAWSASIPDKPMHMSSSASTSTTSRPPGAMSATVASTTRTHTPMARFDSWYQREKEMKQREREREEIDVGD